MAPWVLAVIDDEQSVHDSTRLALQGLDFEGRGFELLSAYSAAEGRALLEASPDIACLLLDVVMENDQAGLDLADEIRGRMGNSAIRIILRTGQPGYAPPLEVLRRFDINDYREKTELTRTRLWAAVACALRGYKHIRALEQNQDGLEMIIRSSASLVRRRAVVEFSQGIVTCLASHLGIAPDGLICVQRKGDCKDAIVVGGAGRASELLGQSVGALPDEEMRASIKESFECKRDIVGPDSIAFSIDMTGWQGVIFLRGRTHLDDTQKRILRLFCHNTGLGLENAQLFAAITDLAYVDGVTGLSTRARLEHAILALAEAGQKPLVLVIDIDNFHFYNQCLGQAFGDSILIAFANRLRFIKGDDSRLGRLYSDVFCLVTPEPKVSQELIARLSEPLLVDGNPLRLSFTFGQARSSAEPGSVETDLIQKAEIALKAARARSRGSIVDFSEDLESVERSRSALPHELREALANGEGLSLAYQPQVDCRTGRVRSVEALMRWRSPLRGVVPPSAFIPAAEATGLIVDLGYLAMRMACREMKPFLDRGWIEHVAVNVSPLQLSEPGLLTRFSQIIEEEGLSEHQVEIEITESAALTDEGTVALLAEARRKGHKIALDDFGTGYSSLSMLRWIPLDLIKIDQSFVPADVGSAGDAISIVKLITGICRQMKFDSILEGVETAEQLAMAQDAGTDFIQGYLIAKPLPRAELATWLTERC
ncbi:hypothetical protein BCY88_29185 [Paraburkholderia fungorum]|uniref:Diguanylate cyclase n=1 Tax=Paraburkholderia fungorum TaxID=134537 RepID=A0A420GGF2_9BURK|nr:hypothetical protein BCY88_29185 [Paraburkholderia fungorum]